MKLKMAENSLFAILMRSKWWLSFAIAAVLATLAAALLPEQYKLIGAMSGSLPFIIVGVIAARRQRGLPSAAKIEQTRQSLSTMAWPEFSSQLEEAFRRDGFAVQRSSHTAYDFELERNGRHTLVSARRWKSARVGLESLRVLQTVRENKDVAGAAYVCLGDLTDNALPFAKQHDIAIWQATDLALMLHRKR